MWNAVFSPDGSRILTTSEDKTARQWSAESATSLAGHKGAVRSAVSSPDGSRILTASEDKTARLWQIFPTTQALVDHVKQMLPRCLTRAQRQTLHLDLAPTAQYWCDIMRKWPFDAPESAASVK